MFGGRPTTIQAVLELSASRWSAHVGRGKQRKGEVGWYGQQSGRVILIDRMLVVQRPRKRKQQPRNCRMESAKPCNG
jgi:hypothetical protein